MVRMSWLRLLGDNGWQWLSAESYEEDYAFYQATIYANGYFVRCLARVSDSHKGYRACGDYGVAWIECDISTYTSREYIGRDDAFEVLAAIDKAESNLLRCGVPFTKDYRFSKNMYHKALRNNAIRKKLGILTIEESRDGDAEENGG